MIDRIKKQLQIWPGEEGLILLLALLFFTTESGRAFGEQTATALFLKRAGADKLPYMYISLGITNMALTTIYALGFSRLKRSFHFRTTVFIIIAALIIEYYFIPVDFSSSGTPANLSDVSPIYIILWLSIKGFSLLLGTLTWNIAGEVTDTRQAKRLFPIISGMGILGALAGTAMITTLANFYQDHIANLLLWEVGFLIIVSILISILTRKYFQRTEKVKSRPFVEEFREGAEVVFGSPLLRLFAFSLILFTILFFAIDLPFNSIVEANIHSEAQTTQYLSAFSFATTVLTFLASFFVANRIVGKIGVVNVNLLLIWAYSFGFILLIMSETLLNGSIARALQVITIGGIVQSANYVYFNVIPPEKRPQALSFTNGVVGQFGSILSGVILLVGTGFLLPGQMYYIGIAITLLAAVVIFFMRNGYKQALGDALKAGRMEVFSSVGDTFADVLVDFDSQAIQVTLDGLKEPNPLHRRLAAEILGRIKIRQALPDLENLFSDPDAETRASAIRSAASFAESTTMARLISMLDDEKESVVRIAILDNLHLSPIVPGKQTFEKIKALSAGPDLEICLSAVRCLANFERIEDAIPAIQALLTKEEPTNLVTGLQGYRQVLQIYNKRGLKLPDLVNTEDIRALLTDDSTRIRREACYTAAESPDEGLVPDLIARLSDSAPWVRKAAASALTSFGEASEGAILNLLDKADDATKEAALSALTPNKERLADKLIAYAQHEVDQLVIWRKLQGAIKSPGRASDLIKAIIAERIKRTEIRLVKAVAVAEPEDAEDWLTIVDSLEQGNLEKRAAAIEILDTIGDTSLSKQIVLPVLDNTNVTSVYASEETIMNPTGAFSELLKSKDPWILAASAQAIAELDLVSLTDQLIMLNDHPDTLVSEAASRALRLLNKETQMKQKTLRTLSTIERVMLLREVPLFHDLNVDDLKQLAELAHEEIFDSGKQLVKEGDEGDEMYILAEGEVEIRVGTGANEQVVATASTGEFFGEMAILDTDKRSASIYAKSPVRSLTIEGDSFKAILRDRPDVALSVLGSMSRRIRSMNDRLRELTTKE